MIATKGGLRREGDRLVRDASPAWLRKGVDASLDALGVDVIDLYQVHWPDPNTPFAETAGALAELVAVGKIRHAGVSNFDAEQMEMFAKDGPLETLQPPYHMFRRDDRGVGTSLLPNARHRRARVRAARARPAHRRHEHAGTVFAPDDWRSNSPDFTGETFRRNLAVVDELKQFAADRGRLASGRSRSHGRSRTRPSTRPSSARATLRTSTDAIDAVDVRLSPEDLAEIDRILGGSAPVHGPSPEGMPTRLTGARRAAIT